jgi:hypothetical protein
MRDLQSKTLIVGKGVLFFAIAAAAATLLLLDRPSLRTAALLAALVWASARFYYFLFYVLEKYVDPRLRYAGLVALLAAIRRRRS